MGAEVLRRTDTGLLIFWCPGCECAHAVWVNEPNDLTGSKWNWNGDMERPTFTPSILVRGGSNDMRCHSFVTNGTISYCSDSKHRLAGQSAALQSWGV
jgi:hypothetical protein